MPPSYTIQILHLSDLHFRAARENEAWRRVAVVDSFLADLASIKKERPIDLVCFTGDVANWGMIDEYIAASTFVERMLKALDLSIDRLFVVPGNHDVERAMAKPTWQKLRQTFAQTDALSISRWLAGGHAPNGLVAQDLQDIFSRQASYREWLRQIDRADLLPSASAHGHLGFRKTVRLPQRPFDIHIIGLDTAWLAGDDNDAGKLLLTEDQVMRLCTHEGHKLSGLKLALCHHPLTELADAAVSQRRLAEHVDLLLRGHLHDAEPSLWVDPDRHLWQLAASCLYEGSRADQYPNGYLLHTLNLDGAGRPQHLEVRFRSRSSRGVWHDDASLYRNASGGRLQLTSPSAQQVLSVVPHPVQPWTPDVGPVPTYSDDAHRDLAEKLLAAQQTLEAQIIAGADTSATKETLLGYKRQLRDRSHLCEGYLLSDGRYKLVSELGQGGFGSVWKAYDRRDAKLVAIKVLHSQWSRDKTRLERFTRGARNMAALHHPHIVHVLHTELGDENCVGFVMEYLPGGDLNHALRKEKLSFEQTLHITQQIGGAMAFAHGRGVVHRDVKPANILLDSDGKAFLTDFDLVWVADTTGGTRTGAGMGTLLYTAPELLDNAGEPTPSADIYSLAMSALAALLGTPPSLAMVRNPEPSISKLPISEAARAVFRRALSWNPDERFASMAEFVDALEQSGTAREASAPLPLLRDDWIQVEKASRVARRAESQDEADDVLIDIYRRECGPNGARLTAAQFFRRGYSIKGTTQARFGWFAFLKNAGVLKPHELRVIEQAKDWFHELETTAMTRSYKMVLVKTLIESGALADGMPLPDLAERSLAILRRDAELSRDLAELSWLEGTDLRRTSARWAGYWRDNPVRAWTTAKNAHVFFTLENEALGPHLPFNEEDEGLFSELTRELVDYRLAQYVQRLQAQDSSFDCKLMTNRRTVILKLPSRKKIPGLPLGEIKCRLPNGSRWNFRLVKEYCNYACPEDSDKNALDALMKEWFGAAAGHPGTQFHVRFFDGADGWRVEPIKPE